MDQLIAFIKGAACAAFLLIAVDAYDTSEVMPFVWLAGAMLCVIVVHYVFRLTTWRRANAKLLA